jgi:signal transduction histidine kinase
MFEPFTRGAAGQPGGRPGTGIGLTIARSLALTFEGSVRLVNAEDGGLIAIIEMKG